MPVLGFGVYQIEDPQVCRQSVEQAISDGYRLIDTAAVYLNEQAVGQAVIQSGLPREEFFITSKLWIQDMSYERAKAAFERTLRRLGTDYLDLYLLHMPMGDVFGAWRALEELYRDGRVRAIGVCNFSEARLADLTAHFETVPAINQVETNIFNQQVRMADYAAKSGIRIEAWGPLAEGRNGFFTNETLAGIGAAYGKSVAQVALRWLIQRGIVVIPKSVRPERIAQNIDVFDFQLTDSQMAAIAACDTGRPVIGDFEDPAFVSDLCSRVYDI